MKFWVWLLAGIVVGLIVGGIIALIASPSWGKPIELPPLPTPSPLFIEVTGSVIHPGLVSLPTGSRVSDAVEAAGGLQPEADLTLLNLAAPVQDGQRLWVPARTTATQTAGPGSDSSICLSSTPLPPSVDNPLNINLATEAQLDLLPGIGTVKAGQIVAYRQQNGPFLTTDEIQNVPGITPSIFEKIKDLIIVFPQP